jgi:hypothetical protein
MRRSGYPINEWQNALSRILSKPQNLLIKLATIPEINFQQSILSDDFQLLFRAEREVVAVVLVLEVGPDYAGFFLAGVFVQR